MWWEEKTKISRDKLKAKIINALWKLFEEEWEKELRKKEALWKNNSG